MYVCMHVCMYVCIVCLGMCASVVYVSVCMHVYLCTMYVCTRVCVWCNGGARRGARRGDVGVAYQNISTVRFRSSFGSKTSYIDPDAFRITISVRLRPRPAVRCRVVRPVEALRLRPPPPWTTVFVEASDAETCESNIASSRERFFDSSVVTDCTELSI